jgi:hypothetical protein
MTELINFSQALSNDVVLAKAMERASLLSKATFIPKDFQNKPSDCLIALMMASKLNVDIFTLMGELYVVHGKPAMSAKFLIAQANRSGVFQGQIKFKSCGAGDDLVVTAYATLQDGSTAEAKASMNMAKMEGWASKNAKYKSMPEHMLEYRAATFLVRKYCPEVTMGLATKEEVEDVIVPKVTEVEKTLIGVLPVDRETVDKMIAAFEKQGQTLEYILDFLGKSSIEEIDHQDVDQLRDAYQKLFGAKNNGGS